MSEWLSAIGGACVVLALLLDSMSYYRQVAKIRRTERSTQVSSSQYIYKMAKAIFALIGLAIYSNFVGMGLEIFMLLVYIASFIVVIKYKPKNWSFWGKRRIK